MSLSPSNDLSGQIFDEFLVHLKSVFRAKDPVKFASFKTINFPKNPEGIAIFLMREFLHYSETQKNKTPPQASLLSQIPNTSVAGTVHVMDLFNEALTDVLASRTFDTCNEQKSNEALALLLFFDGLETDLISTLLHQSRDETLASIQNQKENLKKTIREKDLRT